MSIRRFLLSLALAVMLYTASAAPVIAEVDDGAAEQLRVVLDANSARLFTF